MVVKTENEVLTAYSKNSKFIFFFSFHHSLGKGRGRERESIILGCLKIISYVNQIQVHLGIQDSKCHMILKTTYENKLQIKYKDYQHGVLNLINHPQPFV